MLLAPSGVISDVILAPRTAAQSSQSAIADLLLEHQDLATSVLVQAVGTRPLDCKLPLPKSNPVWLCWELIMEPGEPTGEGRITFKLYSYEAPSV